MQVNGNVFVVTGAGNGIGRRVALQLLARGGIVVAADRSIDGLAETARLAQGLTTASAALSTHVLDVSDHDAVSAFPDTVITEHGRVDGLFNIAGIPQEFETVGGVEDARIETLMQVNFYGTVWLTRAFLPYLEQRPKGGVIMNTSSLSALVPVPGAAVYGASKAAVALFTYGLSQDLRGARSRVTATTVIPGTIWTDLVRDSAKTLGTPEWVAKGFAMDADRAARQMIEATLRGRQRVIVGRDAHVFSAARRVSSRVAERMSYMQVGTFVYRRHRREADLHRI